MSKTLWLVAALWPLTATAEIRLIADPEPPAVFGGAAQTVHVVFHNPDEAPALARYRVRAKCDEWSGAA